MAGWKPYVAGLATALVLLALAGLVVVETGAFDVRASTPHSPIVAWATHTTMIHAAGRGAAGVRPPAAFTPADVVAGFRLYDEDCVACHGAPGIARARWTDGLTPSPPYLVDAPRRWSRRELYWIVANGVKMTAMPAWEESRSSRQIWQVVAFLESQPYLSAADYARLRAAQTPRPHPAPQR
ncbi:MAG TPA: cytochrome c [Caulobacteraceae bacterium]|jgi:mono/diheme cytochrome c family protein|nr:cytochrome c [Caulobacteraceae bacterium]